MIGIIDYGLGNVLAFQNVYKRLNVESVVVTSADDVGKATKLVLPGVGAFDHAMQMFGDSGLRPAVEEAVLGKRVPVLGVCVGMQILARSSEEGVGAGLAWVPGVVKRISSPSGAAIRLPHMGWNDVVPVSDTDIFKGFDGNCRFYFLHSYYFEVEQSEHAIATAEYGRTFCCAVRKGNVYGVQFHPEKSHHSGSQLLQNFAEFG